MTLRTASPELRACPQENALWPSATTAVSNQKLSSLGPLRVVSVPYPPNRGRIYCFKEKRNVKLLHALLPVSVRDESIYVRDEH